MNSAEAISVLQQEFPEAVAIREMSGNPNMLGWYLFSVDGILCYVTPDREVLSRHCEKGKPDADVTQQRASGVNKLALWFRRFLRGR